MWLSRTWPEVGHPTNTGPIKLCFLHSAISLYLVESLRVTCSEGRRSGPIELEITYACTYITWLDWRVRISLDIQWHMRGWFLKYLQIPLCACKLVRVRPFVEVFHKTFVASPPIILRLHPMRLLTSVCGFAYWGRTIIKSITIFSIHLCHCLRYI